MKNILILMVCLLFCFNQAYAQAPQLHSQAGCTQQVNVPAEYRDVIKIIHIPEIKVLITPATYETVTETIVTKEGYKGQKIVCNPDMSIRTCTEVVPDETEIHIYQVLKDKAVYNIIQPASTKTITVKELVKEAHVAIVPCY